MDKRTNESDWLSQLMVLLILFSCMVTLGPDALDSSHGVTLASAAEGGCHE